MPLTITSPANRLYMHFRSSATRARKYVKAMFTTRDAKCGGIYRRISAVITTPNYPYEFATNVECVWSISVEYGSRVLYVFENLNITSSPDCLAAYIMVQKDSESNATAPRLCGILPNNYGVTSTNLFTVTFKANENTFGKFQLTFSKACGGTLNETSGYLKSRSGEHCRWEINGPVGSHITLNILHFDGLCTETNVFCERNGRLNFHSNVTSSNNCSNAMLIHSNESVAQSNIIDLCQDHPATIITTTNQLRLAMSHVNFRAKYSTVQQACGGVLTSVRGILASPYYPSTYPDNVECIWEVTTPRGYHIEVNFKALDIAASPRCNGDYLELRAAEHGQLLGLYCGNEMPTDILSSFESMWIKFRSIEGSTGNGFELSWNFAHVNELNGTGGEIQAPPSYSARTGEPYSWRILVLRGQFVFIQFKEYSSGLQLYDGFDETALEVDIVQSPWQFTSSSNVLYLKTKSDALEDYKILWNAVQNNSAVANSTNTCDKTITLSAGGSQTLTSPGYPDGYDNDLKCRWLIKTTDPGTHVVFKLFEAKLEDTFDCSADNLRVSTSSNLVDWQEELKICQSADMSLVPIKIIHGTPYLKVEFNTDVSINGTGFLAKLQTGCGSNMTGSVGTILDTAVITTFNLNFQCVWHITVRPGRRIAFSFDYAAETATDEKCDIYAIIYDGLDEGAPVVPPGRICNQKNRNFTKLESTTNRVVVSYNLTTLFKSPFRKIWNLTYREIVDCNDEVRLTQLASWVNISSPNYPNVPHPYSECFWTVIGPAGETLVADFIDHFDMNARYCQKEYIELFDGSTALAPSLGRYCRKPNSVHTTGNVLYVHYLSSIAEPRNGFRVNVSIGVCGGTFTTQFGDITSKNYPTLGGYPKYATCEYTIKMPLNSRMRLTFKDLHLPYDANNANSSDRIEIEGVPDVDPESDVKYLVLYGNKTDMPTFDSSSNEILIRFRTFKGNNSYRGFKLHFQRIYTSCFREVNGESGILAINNTGASVFSFPCHWKITVPKGQRVKLEFLKLETTPIAIANISPARYHFAPKVIFYNDYESISKITEFMPEENNTMPIVRSSDNMMLVRLQLGRGAFGISRVVARYSADEDSPCPSDIADTPADILNVNQLLSHENFYCRLRFELTDEQTITFQIAQLEVLKNLPSNQYALLFKNEIYVAPFWTFNSNVSDVLVSLSARRGLVTIQQNEAVRITRLSMNYRRHVCGGTFSLDNGQTLSYPTNIASTANYGVLECVWTLRGGEDGKFFLGNVTLTDSCEREYITFYSGITPSVAGEVRICQDTQQSFAGVGLSNSYMLMLYHAEDYKMGQSNFSFTVDIAIRCGSITKTTITTRTVTIGTKTYKNNFECSWEFWTTENMYFSLMFVDRFFIEDSVNCTKDHIEVQVYEKGLWLPEARFCGREVPRAFNTTAQRIQIIFRTDNDTTGDGFSFRVMPTCSASFNVTTDTQVIRSPKFEDIPYRRLNCEYTFVTDSDKMINVRIKDKFPLRFMPETRKCDLASFRAIKHSPDNVGIEEETYCIEGKVRSLKYLKLIYKSMVSKTFSIEFDLNGCGGNITAPTEIRPLEHETEDNVYSHNMKCIWYVVAPADYSVIVEFKFIEMENSPNCMYDSVTIYTGAVLGEKMLKKLCDTITKDLPVVMVDSNRAVIAAISDDSYSLKGFAAKIRFTRNCNERISLLDGNSPVTLTRHYALNATDELYCIYNVMAPAGYRVSVRLKVLQLDTAANCQAVGSRCDSCNHIELLDSIGADSTSIGKFCSNSWSNRTFITKFEDAQLKLNAIHAGQHSFEIVLEMVRSSCGGIQEFELADDQTINVMMPTSKEERTYAPNIHCVWHITSAKQFQLKFESFQLQNASQLTGLCLDYVHIKAHYTSKYFCGNATGFHIDIPQVGTAYAEISFHSDAEYEDKGFNIIARHYDYCNATYTQLSGNILYTRFEEQHSECVDEIRVPENYTLSLFIPMISFWNYNCSLPHFKVIDINTNKTLLERCPTVYTDTNLFTTTNALRIHADLFANIRVAYVASKRSLPPGCGGELRALEGQISSPPYNSDRNHSDCRWVIEVPAPNTIRIMFTAFNMGSVINCNLDSVTITELAADSSETDAKSFCGPDVPNSYVTKSNRILVVSKKSPNFDGIGWTLAFDSNEDSFSPRQY